MSNALKIWRGPAKFRDRCRIWLFLFVGLYCIQTHGNIYSFEENNQNVFHVYIVQYNLKYPILYIVRYMQYKVFYFANILDVDFEFFSTLDNILKISGPKAQMALENASLFQYIMLWIIDKSNMALKDALH